MMDNKPAVPVRTRLAPTPSGYLHLGNGVNFVVTWLLARAAHGEVRLRIDDHDLSRARPEFVEDIFRELEWLGIDWDEGPGGPDEFHRFHSQRLRFDIYRRLLARLDEKGLLYGCACSRRTIKKLAPSGRYPGICRGRPVGSAKEEAVRVLVDGPAVVEVGKERVDLRQAMGDFVVWRRDNLPAYQLVSLAEDLDHRMTLIVRGEDLLGSSAAQLYLAGILKEAGFLAARFVHHPLIPSASGGKLSKSDNSLSLAAMREAGVPPQEVYRAAARILGLAGESASSLTTMLAAVKERGWDEVCGVIRG